MELSHLHSNWKLLSCDYTGKWSFFLDFWVLFSNFESNLDIFKDTGRFYLKVVLFFIIGISWVSVRLSNWFRYDKSCIDHEVHNWFWIWVMTCNQRFQKKMVFYLYATVTQYTSFYKYISMIGISPLLTLHMTCLSLSQLVKMIPFPLSSTVGVMSVLL